MTERSSLLLPERVMWEKAAVFYNVLGIWPTILPFLEDAVSHADADTEQHGTVQETAPECGYQEVGHPPRSSSRLTTQWSVRGWGGREMCFIEGRGELESMMKQSLGIEPSPAQIILRKAVLSSRFLALNLTGWAYLTHSVSQLIAHKRLLGARACAQLIVKKMILLLCP